MLFLITMSLFKRKRTTEERNRPETAYDRSTLLIDCSKCGGPSLLNDAECVKCLSECISDNIIPSRLIIRRESDTEYSENVISVLNEISKISSMVRTASQEKVPSKCKGCQTSIPKNAKDLWEAFPEPRFDMMKLEAERSSPNREGCEECLWRTIGFLDQSEMMFSELRKNAARMAFRLSEA